MFGLAQSQKMDGKSFCRNFLDLVWFSAYVVRREVGVSLLGTKIVMNSCSEL